LVRGIAGTLSDGRDPAGADDADASAWDGGDAATAKRRSDPPTQIPNKT